ncbi:MAG: cobyrinate a,c-diamide synthase [Rhodocyclaceae bacterium]|nr:cobyrinate a,c-diamide synthase [Rhodocyclaceae bacterium]
MPHRFLVSAAHKSSGKTTVSIGLIAALRRKGYVVQPFKKGPDYIDPLWLTRAAQRGCRNLDFFLSSHEEIRAQFAHGFDADVCLVEGNKGLYDGLALDGANSNAALARLLGLPVILVIDARGMTRGIAPLILGYQAFERDIQIAGVILNRLGGLRHEAKLRAVIEHYTDVPVVGAIPEEPRLSVVERHLGLMPANELAEAEHRIAEIADVIEAHVDLARLLALTHTDRTLPSPLRPAPTAGKRIRLAIAQDPAFGFYYTEDLEALSAAGAELVFFDTLRDRRLPECDALFIGGGFPESFLDALAANEALRAEMRHAIEGGLPTYAECGGLMYLAKSITWQGVTRPMVGILDGDVVMHEKPVGRGYVMIEPTAEHPWCAVDEHAPHAADFCPGALIPAHEFHYSSLTGLPTNTRFAYQMRRGHGIDGHHDGIVKYRLLASYVHLRAVARCDWPHRFIAYARAHCAGKHSVSALESAHV